MTEETKAPEVKDLNHAASAVKKAQVKIDTSQLKSSYCNVANVNSTREEVVLHFGVNQSWDLGQNEVGVELLHRIILSPFAAKRLQTMLSKLLTEYEGRYGVLS